MGVDLDSLSGQPEIPEAGTHAQVIGVEPDPLVGQPYDPDDKEDARLASAELVLRQLWLPSGLSQRLKPAEC
jgi:hypothetical protein